MAKKIQLRRDTATNWSNTNPILSQGEIGIDLTNNKIKIGNGTNAWNSLAYWDDKVTDLSSFAGDIIPDTDNTRSLGSPAKQWKDIYVSNGSVYIGDIKLSNDGGQLVVQQVVNPGQVTEEPVPDTPGVVTTDRLVSGVNTFVLKDNGTVELNGQPFTGGGGANTGDIAFNQGIIYNSNSNGTIYLDPSNDDGNTGFITVPGPADADTNELLIGNQMNGGVHILSGVKTWKFKSDGSLVAPTSTIPSHRPFDTISGPTLKLGDDPTVNSIIITGTTPNEANPHARRIIIQGQKGFGNANTAGEGGDIYIWAGLGGEGTNNNGGTGGDIKIRGGDGNYNEGGYIKIEAGDSRFGNSHKGGDIELNAGSAYDGSTGNAGHVYIRAGTATDNNAEDGRVNLVTAGGDFTWQFNSDGTLNIAGSGTIRNPNNDSAVNLVSTGIGFSQLQWVPDSPTYESANPNNTNSYTHWSWIDEHGMVVEMTETNKTWAFDPNGTLYLPDFGEIHAGKELSITAGVNELAPVWVKEYLPVGNNQYYVRALDYDSNGDLIILGVSYDQESAWLMKTTYVGNNVWRRKFTGSTYAQAMAIDGSNNIYIGHSRDRGSVVKLNSSGEFLWEVDITTGPNPQIMDMEFVSGNLIVTGRDNNIDGVNNKDSMWGVHIDPAGNIGWQSSLTALDAGPNHIKGAGMATDPSTGYTLMVGSTDVSPGSTTHQIVLDLVDGDGENIKTVILQNEFNLDYDLVSTDAACDPNGNGWYVYMVYSGNNNGLTLGVTKLTASLDSVVWSQGYTGTCIDLAANIVTDSDGQVWIFGTYTTAQGFINLETFIRRVNPNTGDTEYQAHFGKTAAADISDSILGGGPYSDKAGRLLAVNDNYIAVAGFTLLDIQDSGSNENLVSWVAQLPKNDTVKAVGNYRLTETSFEYYAMNPVLTDVTMSATHNNNFYEFNWTDEGDIYSVSAPWLITQDFNQADSTWTFRKDRILDTPNGSIGDVGEYGGFDFYAEQNYAGLNFDNRNWMWVEDTKAAVEVYNKDTDTNYDWDFNIYGELVLPEGGDIKDRDGNSVLIKPTTNGTFSTLPDFLDFVQNTRLKTGQNSEGVFFSGNAGNNVEAYPVRTNFVIAESTKVTVTVDMVVNDECSDFGMCVFPTGGQPQWLWGSDESRIAVQYGCGNPTIYGLNDGTDNGSSFIGPATYRVRFTYDPVNTPNVTLETLDTNDTVLDTLTYNETLGVTPQGTYKIGFAADQDDGKLRTYMKNLTIAIDGGPTYTDSLVTSGGGSVSELTGDGYASGTGFKRTVYTNYTGYQGGESTTVWITPADAIGVNDGDTITFRNGDVRTITGNVAGNDGSNDYVQLYWTDPIPYGSFEPAYPLTITTANYQPETKNTARIIPDSSTEGSGQYMDVYVGGAQVLDRKHVHIAGHSADTEVFLGTDSNFVSAKDAGLSPARVNLQSENDITITNTSLRMSQGTTFVSVYGDGTNRNLHGYQGDLTHNIITADAQGNYYVGGEAAQWSEAMVSKYGPNGDLVWTRLVNGDSTQGWQVDGAAHNPDLNEVAFLVQTNYNKPFSYYKLQTFDADTGDLKSSRDIYDANASLYVHEMVYHPTLGYAFTGTTSGETLTTGNVLVATGATGTGIIELPLADVRIDNRYPVNNQNWYISGSNIVGTQWLQGAVGLYRNLPVTTVTGGGSGATLTVRIDYNTMNYIFWSIGDSGGSGYTGGDQLKIPGSLLGGTDGVNDVTFYANSIGALMDVYSLGGVPNPQYFRLDVGAYMGYNSTDFTGGTFEITANQDNRAFVWTDSWTKYYEPDNPTNNNSQSYAKAIAVDPFNGGLVLGGWDNNASMPFVWKLDDTGATTWIRGIEQDNDTVSSLAVSAVNGAVYAATDYTSVNKFSSFGALIKRVHPAGPWGHDVPQIALRQELDGEESVFVGGRFNAAWADYPVFMLNKLNSNLEHQWSRDIDYENTDTYINYDQWHRYFALGQHNAVMVGYTYAMSPDFTNGMFASISTDDDFENVGANGWSAQNPGRNIRFEDVTGDFSVTDMQDNQGVTVANTTLLDQDNTDPLTWTTWSYKNSTVNLDDNNHGIVGVQGINFAEGGLLSHNPADIPPSPTDFYQNGWSYTLQPHDRGRFIINQPRPNSTYASNLYITVPRNGEVYFPVGSVITLINANSAEANGYRIYVQPENGVGASDAPKIWATGGNQNPSTWSFQGIQTATLMKIGSNEWLLTANDITDEN